MAVFSFRGNEAIPMSDSIMRQRAMANSGAAKVVLSPQWNPPPEPFKAYADQLRRDEARAQALVRAQEEARTKMLNDQLTRQRMMNPTLIPMVPQSTIDPNAPALTANQLMNPSGVPLRGDAFNVDNTLINPEIFDSEKLKGRELSDSFNKPLNTGGVNDRNLRNVNPISADNAARMAGEDVGSIYSDNANTLSALVTDPNQNRKDLAKIREQVYGKPITRIEPNGDETITYPNDRILYHGIDANMQAAGAIAGRVPNAIDPNATDAEKFAFAQKYKNVYVPPQYKLGQEYTSLAIMTKGEKIDLQKNLRRAGYYPKGFQILPGFITNDEIGFLQAAMGEGNVAGLELPDVFDVRERMRKRAIAAEKAARSGGGGGDTTRSVDIRFDTTTMAAGRVLLNRILTDALGRSPSESELSQFMAMLNEAESKSPTKTITEYVNSGDTRRSTTRTTPSGLDPEAMAEDFAAGIDGGAPMTANKETDYLMGYLNSLGANA